VIIGTELEKASNDLAALAAALGVREEAGALVGVV
jgi:hypothetical protein